LITVAITRNFFACYGEYRQVIAARWDARAESSWQSISILKAMDQAEISEI